MRVFVAGAVSSASENQLKKYNTYKKILFDVFDDLSLTTPDDIWEFRESCRAKDPKATKLEIDRMMTDFDLQKVRESDLIVCDISSLSTGMGIELGVAKENNVNVIFCFEEGTAVSNMITGTFAESAFVSYKNLSQLETKLANALKSF